MSLTLRATLCLSALALAACDEVAVSSDPEARADGRGQRTCVKAVADQTGASGVKINTTIPVIETNYFIVDVPGAKSWTCLTDDSGRATQLVERRS